MSSKRILGIAGAAMIGTLAGTSVAHATIGVDGTGNVTGAISYAREVLLTSATQAPTDGNGTYYVVSARTGASGELDVHVPIGITASGTQQIVVRVDLENMVFARSIEPLVIWDTSTGAALVGSPTGLTTPSGGGALGDRSVTWSVTNGSVAIAQNDELRFSFRRFGVDPMMPGSITVTATYVFAGITNTEATRLVDAVKVVTGLETTVTPTNQTALVAENFQKFRPGTGVSTDQLMASVGRIRVGTTGTSATSTNVILDANSGEITGVQPEKLVSAAKVTITGITQSMLGDGGDVEVSDNADCSSGRSIVDEDDGSLEAALTDVDGLSGGYICIKVNGETEIPQVGPLSANITYTGLTNAAFAPTAADYPLGSIGRDGASVYIPWLTTDDRYNQRIVLWNRSSRDAGYTMTFTPESDVSATPGNDATGTLAPNSRTVLSMRHDDVVTFSGGNRSSALIMIVAPSNMIEASTVTLNRGDGSTDTVVYSSQ